MTKAQIAAKEVFERFPNAKEVFVTPDEQAFLDKNRAAMHNGDFQTVLRSEVISKESKEASAEKTLPAAKSTPAAKTTATAKQSAEELIEAIKTIATITALDVVAKGEKRGSVKDAIAVRRAELVAEIVVKPEETKTQD
jgi:hypothetical protein